MIELSLSHLFMLLSAISGGLASYFMLRGRVATLENEVSKLGDHSDRLVRVEEGLKGYSKAVERIFSALERIEEKIDTKADR